MIALKCIKGTKTIHSGRAYMGRPLAKRRSFLGSRWEDCPHFKAKAYQVRDSKGVLRIVNADRFIKKL